MWERLKYWFPVILFGGTLAAGIAFAYIGVITGNNDWYVSAYAWTLTAAVVK